MASPDFEQSAEDFGFLDEWEDRYRYVIDLGKTLTPLSEIQKNAVSRVDGCASQVWIVPDIEGSGPEARFSFAGESDAMIVSGLIAVLHRLYQGLTVREVLETDARQQLARLGLDQHLSSQRSNGLRAMVERIRTIARTTSETP